MSQEEPRSQETEIQRASQLSQNELRDELPSLISQLKSDTDTSR